MQLPVFIDSTHYSDAELLISNYGEEAGLEAANRADRSRSLGNHIHYCKSIDQSIGTIH